jgi:hypothetical protein
MHHDKQTVSVIGAYSEPGICDQLTPEAFHGELHDGDRPRASPVLTIDRRRGDARDLAFLADNKNVYYIPSFGTALDLANLTITSTPITAAALAEASGLTVAEITLTDEPKHNRYIKRITQASAD